MLARQGSLGRCCNGASQRVFSCRSASWIGTTESSEKWGWRRSELSPSYVLVEPAHLSMQRSENAIRINITYNFGGEIKGARKWYVSKGCNITKKSVQKDDTVSLLSFLPFYFRR